MLTSRPEDRTATTSLTVALNMLGYKALHISDLLPNRLQELAVLEEAFTANATPGKKAFGRREFDKMWADYDVSTGHHFHTLSPNISHLK